MISNYHTASYYPETSGAAGSAHYTFSGFDSNPVEASKKNTRNGGGKKPGDRRGMRGLRGWGRGRTNSGDTIQSDGSNGAQSLSYSTGSSVQSAGEATESSDFSGILKVLDDADRKELAKAQGNYHYTRSGSTNHSVASSLYYSDTDGETSQMGRSKLSRGASVNSDFSTDDSTDQESHLEGSKLINMLMDE